MNRKILIILLYVLAGVALWGFSVHSTDKSGIAIEKKVGASGLSSYAIFYKNTTKIDFEVTRPDKKNDSILLCIPAAFTNLNTYKVDGLYICNGIVGNRDNINRTLGGGIKFNKGECTIFHTGYGKLLSDSLVDSIAAQKGSFFQQIWMIDNGKVANINEDIITYRRGIAIFNDGRTAIIESTAPVTLQTFANDLAKLGVHNLIYTDMGSWDEGWYRNPENGNMVSLGYSHSATENQSNWVVFKK